MPTNVIVALYKFVSLPDFVQIRESLLDYCQQLQLRGTLLLAAEGINGTVSGSRENIDQLLTFLKTGDIFKGRLANLEHKESHDSDQPFYRMKVKLKKEIVTMGVEDIDPNTHAGTYVDPQQWNYLVNDPEVTVVDTRNYYEYEIGTFKNAINPNTTTFRELPAFIKQQLNPGKHKKVAMFCTGGIRCEKSTAYMKKLGFEQVYHLKGGILNYLEKIPEAESTWQGECFVFDNRVAVDHNLQKGKYDQCHGCRHPITEEEKQSEKYLAGVSCPRCFDKQTSDQRARFSERQKQILLAKDRNDIHIGAPPPARQRQK